MITRRVQVEKVAISLAGLKAKITPGEPSNPICQRHNVEREKIGDGDFTVTVCPKCTEEQAEEERLNEAETRKNLVSQLLANAGIPLRFVEKTLDNYQLLNPRQRENVEYVREWVQRGSPGGLVFCGRPGTGKNHIASGLIRYMITQRQKSAVMTTAFRMMREIKATWGDNAAREGDVVSSFVKPYLLVIDEVGVQFNSETEKLYLSEIINARYEALKPSVMLTNLTVEELARTVGERVIDRFREGGKVLIFDWGSFRGSESQGPGAVPKSGMRPGPDSGGKKR